MRGPLVYCLEEKDNGGQLHLLALPKRACFAEKAGEGLFAGVTLLETQGLRLLAPDGEPLYTSSPDVQTEVQKLSFIPYFCWANRGENEMLVWIREPSLF